MKKFLIVLLVLSSSITWSQKTIQPSVSVTGEGIIKIAPDVVTINVQVEHKGQNPKELKQKNDKIISDVLSYIKSLNIDDKDVKTQYVRLNKNYDYQTKTYNYVANQNVVIKLNDLTKYEGLMNGLLERGINRIDGINFSTSKEEALKSEARRKAIMNAKTKAEEYAKVLDQSVGKAISISEFSGNSYPTPMYESVLRVASDGGDTSQQTISVGIIEIRTTINVIFELN
ncbi:MAG: SIMPL domain-containing protein [Flavobacteriaceae bacterium]